MNKAIIKDFAKQEMIFYVAANNLEKKIGTAMARTRAISRLKEVLILLKRG
jgi:hypothetical protein